LPIYRVPEADRERVRYHLGWLNVEPVATFTLGFPSTHQSSLILERAMDNLASQGALDRVLRILETLDRIEQRQVEALGRLGIQSVDGIKFRNSNDEATLTDLLQLEYRRWQTKLAAQFGVAVGPGGTSGTPFNTPVATLI
jgi:hypothetical protein